MQKKPVLLLSLFLWYQLASLAQVTDERIYVQTDRSMYAKGETVHFKAYVISGSSAEIQSSNLFVEIWDSLSQKAGSLCLPVIDGTASGSLLIPATVKSNHVFLRAFSDISILQPAPFQFVRHLSSPDKQPVTDLPPVLIPEGGSLVYNADNYIAYRAAPGATGVIQNSKGEAVGNISAGTYGTGMFSFRPLPGEKYSCRWTIHDKEQTLSLPVPVEEGIAVHVYQTADTLRFDLDNGGNMNLRIRKPKVQLLINGEVAYVVALNMTSKNKFSYFIPLNDFLPTTAVLQVLDQEDQLLASRPVFIGRRSLSGNMEMEVKNKDLGKRGENSIRFRFKDTLIQQISVSITDAGLDESAGNTGFASVLLPDGVPELQGRMSPPLIDLALLVSGIAPDIRAPADTNPIIVPRHLQLSGSVKKGKKPVAGKELMLGVRSAYTGKELYKVQTDAEGRFFLDDMILYDTSYVHVRMPGDDGDELTPELNLRMPAFTENESFREGFRKKAMAAMPATLREISVGTEDTLILESKAIMLEEVIIKTDQNLLARKRLEELEKKYVDGSVFSGYFASGETLDVMNDPLASKFLDLFTYIGSKMRSVTQRFVRGRKELVCFGRGTGGETILTTYYLGNSKIERDLVDGIRLDEVAVVKFVPMLASENGFPPALAIYLKKAGDQGYWEKDRYQLSEQVFRGYTVPKDFSAPDYSRTDVQVQKDLRKTLLWQPYTRVEKGEAEIRFYNTDRTRRIRIVAEGLTPDGNIIYFEQVLE